MKPKDYASYEKLYNQSIENPETFWGEQSLEYLSWSQPWSDVRQGSIAGNDLTWFPGGTLNMSYNCIDRHVESGQGDRVAYFWESNAGDSKIITYKDLLSQVSRFANLLESLGVQKGDRVCIYMPMIPEAVYAMLACSRLGAVHSVVFAGFSTSALKNRIQDAHSKVIITADAVVRGAKQIPLIDRVVEASAMVKHVESIVVIDTGTHPVSYTDARVVNYYEVIEVHATTHKPVPVAAEDLLFLLYTSGSTGKPKGVCHSTAGYALSAALSFDYVFDYHPDDVFFCAADIGWITGHSYLVYGPLLNGATSVLYEGVPTYPTPSRLWEMVDTYNVTTLYTSPATLRSLLVTGDSYVKSTSRQSLRILGSVGEPIDPKTWQWYHDVVGNGACSIVDTWWQTETGSIALTPLPHQANVKPGAVTQPFFGIEPVILDTTGKEIPSVGRGALYLRGTWPGQARSLYNDRARFIETYYPVTNELFCTGDGAYRDADGDIWITGRIDDAVNVSGRLLYTAEIEGAIVSHASVFECAVVGIDDTEKGSSTYAFVVTDATVDATKLKDEVLRCVTEHIGSFAKPSRISIVPALPKTRSGKVMRRILRSLAVGGKEYGDTSTLSDATVVDVIRRAISEES